MGPRKIPVLKPSNTLESMIRAERARRMRVRPAYRYWMVRGLERPRQEYWCAYCAGWFGVPHEFHSDDFNVVSCRFVPTAVTGRRVCACIECECAEKLGQQMRQVSRSAR